MADQLYDELALERNIRDRFGLGLDVHRVIADSIPVSHTATATIFLTEKKQLYAYIHAESKLLLSDIKKLVARMGLRAELYVPPKGQPQYFDDIGRQKFTEVFPGRSQVSRDDIAFYRTLAPYNPALVQIQEIKTGEIFQFDSDARSGWRVAAKFAYRRIKTS